MENGLLRKLQITLQFIHFMINLFVQIINTMGSVFCYSEIDKCRLSFFSCNNLLYLFTGFLTSLITQYGSHPFRCEIFKDIYSVMNSS